VLLFVQAIVAASYDPNMSVHGTAGKRKHVTLVFSQKRGLKVESFSTVHVKKKQEDQF
jgi:hypothetical protein